jgi:GTPase SAR1 family protein
MPGIAVYGDSGIGKTTIMEEFRRDPPPQFDPEAGRVRTRVLALQMAGALSYCRMARRSACRKGKGGLRNANLVVDGVSRAESWFIALGTIGCSPGPTSEVPCAH